MDKKMKQLIKEAILEALVEFTNGGVQMMSDGDTPNTDPDPDPEGDGNEDGNQTPTPGEGDKDPIEPPVIFPPVGLNV